MPDGAFRWLLAPWGATVDMVLAVVAVLLLAVVLVGVVRGGTDA